MSTELTKKIKSMKNVDQKKQQSTNPQPTQIWKKCPVRGWNTSCRDEKICMFPDDPKCPTNSSTTEIIND